MQQIYVQNSELNELQIGNTIELLLVLEDVFRLSCKKSMLNSAESSM